MVDIIKQVSERPACEGAVGRSDHCAQARGHAQETAAIPDAWREAESLKKLIDQLIEDGKIEEWVSEWNSPSFHVAKKESGKWRLVDDFRALNDVTITDAHPMPLIQPNLNKQGKCRVWLVLDMKDGYH